MYFLFIVSDCPSVPVFPGLVGRPLKGRDIETFKMYFPYIASYWPSVPVVDGLVSKPLTKLYVENFLYFASDWPIVCQYSTVW